ncbi:hypothetical protein B0T26DRAFT_718094 [Lasiosphaeria miniovina]|uniref:Uncharacterized protein n=1 Tax=Lasiosphaeria miniovina TaxID=1954250 RepID=A0AA40DRN9_9PEZI|nr:uncharacterized protein B0T26DRAFT_718094 [Lasiosphaeria miniovina]KAK0713674.1 hypothetical protein B0T26DRAFT_718094 [Lasiosphaeria miniovina]
MFRQGLVDYVRHSGLVSNSLVFVLLWSIVQGVEELLRVVDLRRSKFQVVDPADPALNGLGAGELLECLQLQR